MGKIYSAPEGMTAPDISKFPYDTNSRFDKYQEACDRYVDQVKAWCKQHGGQKESGEEIAFPVGDGKARYVVFSLKPVQLIHLEVGDAYHERYVHRLTAADIRKEIKGAKALREMFSEGKKKAKA